MADDNNYFTAVKRIRKDPDKSLNADAVAFFRERRVLNEWEYNFCQNTMRSSEPGVSTAREAPGHQ